jgi:hypothetical protein
MNRAETDQAMGVAYDPSRGAWRQLAPSPLDPQAVSIVALPDGELFAWDYLTSGSSYDPKADVWSDPVELPLRESECFPQTVVVHTTIFARYCSQSAVSDGGPWTRVDGGIADDTADVGDGAVAVFMSATLTAADDVVALVGEGITIQDGIPCFGCAGAPAAFWVYRP